MNCVACILKSKGVNPKEPPAHTCLRATDKKYKEPESKSIGQRTFFKVEYKKKLAWTPQSSLFTLHVQYLNGYKTKSGVECWFFNDAIMDFETDGQPNRPYKWFWLEASHYYKLSFVL